MAALGYVLVIAGFLGATYVASLDPETVNWPALIGLIVLGGVGVFLLKRASRAAAQSDTVLAGNREDLQSSLTTIVRTLAALKARKDSVAVDAFRAEIEETLRPDIIRFIRARDSMKPLYGLQTYADVMSAFAAGERALNRIWSASADGYEDEARTYVDVALERFTEAQAKLAAAA